MRQQRRVVAAAGADLEHGLAGLRRQGVEAEGVEAWLADMDAPLGVERNQHVLVEKGGIVVRRPHVDRTALPQPTGRRCHDRPGRRPGERFPWDRREGRLDPPVRDRGRARDQGRIDLPQLGAARL
ncbi:hypothetical protein [Methylobacterium tardum]|uniref:hypothetical protein n=1 Tax=Methylobacterium tardum TaxID=374432 RepID=UPI00325FA9F0